jgi:hypothetical protein
MAATVLAGGGLEARPGSFLSESGNEPPLNEASIPKRVDLLCSNIRVHRAASADPGEWGIDSDANDLRFALIDAGPRL